MGLLTNLLHLFANPETAALAGFVAGIVATVICLIVWHYLTSKSTTTKSTFKEAGAVVTGALASPMRTAKQWLGQSTQ